MTEQPPDPRNRSTRTPVPDVADEVDDLGGQLDLRAILLGLGVPEADVDQAEADDTLELLALSRIVLHEEHRFDVAEVAAITGVEVDQVRAYWRALGFPDPPSGEKIFSDVDVELLANLVSFIDEGTLEPELAMQMGRVLGSAMAKIANAQVESLEVRQRRQPIAMLGVPAARRSVEMLAIMPRVMEFVWRRQLAAAARRRMMRAGGGEATEGVLVGFADLVGFTAKTQQLAEDELAEVVGRFESVAFDIVARHGGRVVKMIGDEVMFLHEDVHAGAALALALAARFRDDPVLSDVRVGLASGPVLERDGDVYGHVVNLANRLVSFAYPGTVVVSADVHDALADDARLVLRPLRPQYLKDIGRVPLWVVRTEGDRAEAPYARERARRAGREFLRPQRAELNRETVEISSELPHGLRHEILGHAERSEPSTGQLDALTAAVLDADLDPDVQVTLLGDLEAARRLRQLEREAQDEAARADEEAERQREAIQREARVAVEEVEADARRRIEALLADAEQRSRQVNDEASRKVQQVAEEVERKAELAAQEARAQAARRARGRGRRRSAG